jgi:hypothetical protein
MNNIDIVSVWPINSILNDLKITIPPKYPQEIFSTNYIFENIVISTCFLLDKDPNYFKTDIYSAFVDAILSKGDYPIAELENITKNKAVFTGRLGFVELLFRGNVKKQKRKKGKWYNTDININCDRPRERFLSHKSDQYKLFGHSKSKFELYYYNEIGLPYNFEKELINRLTLTKDGPYYAVAIYNDKRQRIRKDTSDSGFQANDEYRIVSQNQKVLNSVLEICKNFRIDKKDISKVSKPSVTKSNKNKPSPTIPLSIRKQVWRVHNGNVGSSGCFVCNNVITALEYECGHIIPRSKGGENTIDNLLPICGICNKSMSDTHLFEYVEKHFKNLQSKCFYLPSYLDWKRGSWYDFWKM